MGDISIIEFTVYGFIAYVSLLMLIIQVARHEPLIEPPALVKSVWLIPGIICAGILANSGTNITLETVTTVNFTNDTVQNIVIFFENATTTSSFVLIDPVWQLVHIMIMLVLLIYVFNQLLMLFGLFPSPKGRK